MKTAIKLVTSAALCATSVSPFLASAAMADTIPQPVPAELSSTNAAAMQSTCDALAQSHDTMNGDRWTGVVMPGSIDLVAGPTEVASSRVIEEGTITGTGTLVPSATEIRFGDKGGPFRIGGSVNMFGDQWATAGYYPDSTYFYTADFTSSFSHAYSCQTSQEIYHPPVHHPATKVKGFYINCDFGHGQGNDNSNACTVEEAGEPQGSCAAHNAVGDTLPFWGEDKEQCKFIVTEPAHDAYDDPEYWDAPIVIETLPQTPIVQEQTDNLRAFEDHGGRVNVTGEYKIDQVVVCISPSSTTKKGVPGAWRPQNGYSGGNMLELTPAVAGCNTKWFNVAQWGSGTPYANGTYISVPHYVFP